MVYIIERSEKMYTLNKKEKTIRAKGLIFNYSYYNDDGESYIFYYQGIYIGFVDINKINEIIEE